MALNKKFLIIHFDVDNNFSPFFKEKKYSFSLNSKNLKLIPLKSKIQIVTLKSNSKINWAVIKALPNLKAIVSRTVGLNHINLDLCKKNNIAVYHVPDYGAFAIAEHVFALILSQTRKIIQLNKETQSGNFNWQMGQGFTLNGKTLGIIGVGKTGKETAKIAKGFQMKILGFDAVKDKKIIEETGLKYVSLTSLLKNSDVVSINMPLIKETYHLISEKEIKLMKKGVILVNVSRGELLDTKALVKHIKKFRYICLDVIEGEERYNINDPIIKKLLSSHKVTITPHVAFFTDLTVKKIARITKENIANFIANSDENRVV